MSSLLAVLLGCLLFSATYGSPLSGNVMGDEDLFGDEDQDFMEPRFKIPKLPWKTIGKGALAAANAVFGDEDIGTADSLDPRFRLPKLPWKTIGKGALAAANAVFGDEDMEIMASRIPPSCDKNGGLVCIPTACHKNQCLLFKEAVCVADRCGCEARFFNWMEKEKIYSDVTKMCDAGNFVLNFVNYTIANNSKLTADEDQLVTRHFFKEFNLLVTEILKDITDYVREVSLATPTDANIAKLKETLVTLHKLRSIKTPSDSADSDSADAEPRANLGAALQLIATRERIDRQAAQATKHALSKLGRVQDLSDVEPRNYWTNIGSMGGAIGAAAAGKRQDVEPKRLDVETGKKTITPIRKQFVTNAAVLHTLLNEKGPFTEVVKSGNVAISSKTAQRQLRELLDQFYSDDV